MHGISRELGNGATRRGFLRWLGSVAALGALAAVGASGFGEPATARRRGRKRRKKNTTPNDPGQGQPGQGTQDQVCLPGTAVADLIVPFDGSVVQTSVLLRDQRYRFRASGVVGLSPNYVMDPEYIFVYSGNSVVATDVDSGIDVGLSIDDNTTDESILPYWGDFNVTHTYEHLVVGEGRPVDLKLHDGDYSDNSGTIQVTITCA